MGRKLSIIFFVPFMAVACGKNSNPSNVTTTPPKSTDSNATTNSNTTTAGSGQNPRFIGRFDTTLSTGPRFAWPGTAIETHFSGSSTVGVKIQEVAPMALDGQYNYYEAVIDGNSTPVIIQAAPSKTSYPIATGLDPSADHTVRVTKRTEAQVGESQFLGFELDQGATLLATTDVKHRIEFIGDSITAGYGVDCQNQNEAFTPATENAVESYGVVTASELGNSGEIDYSLIAWAGKGLLRNNDGSTTKTIPSLYGLTLPAVSTDVWNFKNWQADVVVINVGTNDFAAGAPDQTQFETAYGKFLQTIRGNYPNAMIYCIVGPMLSNVGTNAPNPIAQQYLQDIVQTANQNGDQNVKYVQIPSQMGPNFGCEWHPSADEQASMADVLVNQIKQDLSW